MGAYLFKAEKTFPYGQDTYLVLLMFSGSLQTVKCNVRHQPDETVNQSVRQRTTKEVRTARKAFQFFKSYIPSFYGSIPHFRLLLLRSKGKSRSYYLIAVQPRDRCIFGTIYSKSRDPGYFT
jgi:hypothetical protein